MSSNSLLIAVDFEMEDHLLSKVRLSLNPHFSLSKTCPDEIKRWFDAYLQGKHPIVSLPIDDYTPFQQKVWKTLQRVPFGMTVSYKQLALLCECPDGARAVGNACNKNPFPLLIPCHRVIASNEEIGGFAIDLEIKKRLLEFERAFAPSKN